MAEQKKRQQTELSLWVYSVPSVELFTLLHYFSLIFSTVKRYYYGGYLLHQVITK